MTLDLSVTSWVTKVSVPIDIIISDEIFKYINQQKQTNSDKFQFHDSTCDSCSYQALS